MGEKLWIVKDPRRRKLSNAALGVHNLLEDGKGDESVGTYFIAAFRRRSAAVQAARNWKGAEIVEVALQEVHKNA